MHTSLATARQSPAAVPRCRMAGFRTYAPHQRYSLVVSASAKGNPVTTKGGKANTAKNNKESQQQSLSTLLSAKVAEIVASPLFYVVAGALPGRF